MYALRERRQHVTQEDFEFAVAKVRGERPKGCVVIVLTLCTGSEEEPGREHVCEQAVLVAVAIGYRHYFCTLHFRALARPKWQQSGRELPELAEQVRAFARSFISFLSSHLYDSIMDTHHHQDALILPPLQATHDALPAIEPEEADVQAAAIDVPDDTADGGRLRMIVQLVKRSFGVKDLAAM
jgi:hypothetical protein